MSSKRALIVDDSTTAQYRLKKMLASYDLDVDIVDSGEAALLYLAKHLPDVIFMDHLMSGMDGLRVLQIIKSHPETAMVPVIMYTSKSGDVYTGQARALGALDVISKDSLNRVELSKVMASIHIAQKAKTTFEEPMTDRKVTDGPEKPPPEIRPREVTADNTRRIELRIVQLEHAIEDSRRVSAAQLLREMQKLRHGLKQELGNLLNKALGEKPATSSSAQETSTRSSARAGSWFFRIALIACLILLILLIYRQSDVNQLLQQLQAQQQPRNEMLEQLSNHLLDVQLDILNQQNSPTESVSSRPASTHLEDFIWAFNQNSQLPFSSRLVEASLAVRLNEFLTRLSRQGFRGSVWVNLTLGDYCVELDNYGLAQLPDTEVSLNQCTLLSEVYPFQGMADQAVEDINASLIQNPAVARGDLVVVISRIEDQALSYPPRDSPILASDWNKIAQSANRVTIAVRSLSQE